MRYLEFYCNVPSFLARKAHLTSMSLSAMHISTSPTSNYLVPLDPPLTDYSQARERVVEMDRAAVQGLGRSDITIKEYTTPSTLGLVNISLVALTFLLMHRRANLEPQSPASLLKPLATHFPGFLAFLHRIQPYMFAPVLTIHIAEMLWLDLTRLSKHSVPRLSATWYKWMLGHFFEGFTSFQRFDALVFAERAKKEKRAH